MICFKYQLKHDLLVVINSTVGNGSVLPIVDCCRFGWFSSSITLSFNLLDVLDLCFRTSSIRTGIYSYNFFVLAGVVSHFFVCFLNFLECRYSPDLYCAWSLLPWKLWSKQQVVLLYGMTGFCNKQTVSAHLQVLYWKEVRLEGYICYYYVMKGFQYSSVSKKVLLSCMVTLIVHPLTWTSHTYVVTQRLQPLISHHPFV